MILELATAFFIDSADKALGTTEETKQMIEASQKMNRESDAIMRSIAQSTDDILRELAVGNHLVSQEMKNDNLRRFKEIEKERRILLNS
jgi:hypothetical protein